MPSSPPNKYPPDVSTPSANSSTRTRKFIHKIRDSLDTQKGLHITPPALSPSRGTLEFQSSSENTPKSNPHTDALAFAPTQSSPKPQSPYAPKPLLHVPFESPMTESSEMPATVPGNSMHAARTSRVIEQLAKELDRHKREISLLTAKLDEEQQRSETSRILLESARESARHSELMYDQAEKMSMKKSRKLTSITAELEGERSRRVQAEKEKNEAIHLLDKTVAETQKELTKEKELAGFANAQYETLKGAMKSERKSLRTGIADLRLGFLDLKQQRQADSQNLRRLESVSRESCKQHAEMDKAHQALVNRYQLYRAERDGSLQPLVDKAHQIQETGESLTTEMEDVLGKMKYIVNVKETLQG
ncbi:hypothetical protein MMC10_010804 [Thelotrema lepadinum]|nr:hypothetical protein [Thelotrema lepadinum]